MIVEFELQGSKCLHKGIFSTDGFWVKFEEDVELIEIHDHSDLKIEVGKRKLLEARPHIKGYKLYSHMSFAFFHENKEIVDLVYFRLISVLRGSQSVDIENIGYFRRLNK